MNIWFFVILILAIGLVLGPIAMLKPKPAQQRREALRLHAARQGIRFGIRKPPTLKTAMEPPTASAVYYLAPTPQIQVMPTWILVRTHYEHEGNFYRDWDWYDEQRPTENVGAVLRKYLPGLPESVTVISQGEAGTCVFWSEKEGTEVLDLQIEMLKELQANAT